MSDGPAAPDVADLQRQLDAVTTTLSASLDQLALDERLMRIAGSDMPDACARLRHVLSITESAANRTLDLVEDSKHALNHDELPPLLHNRLRGNLNGIAEAQAFQDLSGQIIGRVIGLVHNVEQALDELLRLSGRQTTRNAEQPVMGPAVAGLDTGRADQQQADDLLADLGL